MRIAVVVNTFPPYWTGVGLASMNLAKALIDLGLEIEIFIPKAVENKDYDYGEMIVNRLPAILRFGHAPLVPGYLKIKDFDAIHLHFPYYFGAELISLVSMFRGIPVFITYHNDVIKPGIIGSIVDGHSHYIAPRILQRAAKIFIMSEEFLSDSIGLNFMNNHDNVIVIPQGVDTNKFNPNISKSMIRDNLNISQDKIIILFVRSLDKSHHNTGLSDLIQAVKLLGENYHLIVVGEGELRAPHEAFSVELGLGDQVHFLGGVPNDQLPGIYRASDIFTLPSLETENASVAILEAMACGIPVVATNLGGTKKLVLHNNEGLLVPPNVPQTLAEAIGELGEDYEKRRRFGIAASNKVETEMSWHYVASHIKEEYQKIQ